MINPNSEMSTQISSKLPIISYESLIENQVNKDEEFVIVNDGNFSLWSINNEDVDSLHKKQISGLFYISNTGLFMVNCYKDKLVCYATNFSKIFTKLYFDSKISTVKFSSNDTFLIINTQSKVYVVNIFKGEIIITEDKENIEIDMDEKLIYLTDSKKCLNIDTLNDIKYPDDLKIYKTLGDQSMCFYEGRSQKVIYSTRKFCTKKNQANIDKINFGFTNKIGYAYFTKTLKNLNLYTLEIYKENKIYMINFDTKPVDFKVSNNMVLVFDTLKNVIFYKQDKTGYIKFKNIEKEGDVILSLSRNVACLYDEITENIEFYDKGELRSVYLHRGCSELQWSKSGLYLAAVSETSGLLQIFNNNGKIIFKKVFNIFDKFIWRPFITLTDEEKEKINNYDICKYISELNVSAASEYNLETLITKWKNFLISKQQLINKLS